MADVILHAGEILLGLLDAGARRTADVQPQLPGIHAGEEILANQKDRLHEHSTNTAKPATTSPRCCRAHSSSPP